MSRMLAGNGLFYPIIGFASFIAFLYLSFGHLWVNYSKEINLSFVERNGTQFFVDEGIRLIGASRVVLLDVLWNPSVEQQAISQAYRNGQKFFLHVYRPVTSKWEVDKIEQQARKRYHSDVLLSRNVVNTSCSVSEDDILESMVKNECPCHIFEKLSHASRVLPSPCVNSCNHPSKPSSPLRSRAAKAIGFTDIMIDYSLANAPLPKESSADEVGNTAAFLASPLASAITGAVIYVDNGLNAMGVGVDSPIFKDLNIPKSTE
ncbi:Enoyl-[acyl-carrier-protein] reductase [NADH], chloroplastic [Capsicum baccatum]|uniref:Enoyl-[acyl-carrier-protein] reductase [NADH], chloroplastic n=1 Tax=Capsicum baccatum TaxID=33114 RepID=A0A2G2XNG1_CAPBA|nr:Enoyl-[acyl-carrier-protein] reductase [NADH], chloroplastic [Capsicum baccatum]